MDDTVYIIKFKIKDKIKNENRGSVEDSLSWLKMLRRRRKRNMLVTPPRIYHWSGPPVLQLPNRDQFWQVLLPRK